MKVFVAIPFSEDVDFYGECPIVGVSSGVKVFKYLSDAKRFIEEKGYWIANETEEWSLISLCGMGYNTEDYLLAYALYYKKNTSSRVRRKFYVIQEAEVEVIQS